MCELQVSVVFSFMEAAKHVHVGGYDASVVPSKE